MTIKGEQKRTRTRSPLPINGGTQNVCLWCARELGPNEGMYDQGIGPFCSPAHASVATTGVTIVTDTSKPLGPQSDMCTACGRDKSIPESMIPGCSSCTERPLHAHQTIVDPPSMGRIARPVAGSPQVSEPVIYVLPNGKLRPAIVLDVPDHGDGQALLRVMSTGPADGKGFERDQNLLAGFSQRKEANTWHRRSV